MPLGGCRAKDCLLIFFMEGKEILNIKLPNKKRQPTKQTTGCKYFGMEGEGQMGSSRN